MKKLFERIGEKRTLLNYYMTNKIVKLNPIDRFIGTRISQKDKIRK